VSSGLVNLALRCAVPGNPGSARLANGTAQLTTAVTAAGNPTGTDVNWLVSMTTAGLQSSPSWRSAARALTSPAVCAAAGVSAIEACRAASRAAASTEPCATVVRPAAITRLSKPSKIGARMTSSSAALPLSARPALVRLSDALLAGLVTIVALGAGGFGIANEKKWGYAVAVAGAVFQVIMLFAVFGSSVFTSLLILNLLFDGALVALLLHPMSREYQRIWFK